jgi:fumarylpyruvate hydrolase|tara:strand:- start:245 stop:487 length:243 start_codon:yes stop_codon:yes gene_type:complete
MQIMQGRWGMTPTENRHFSFPNQQMQSVASNSVLVFPSMTSDLHHEIELVVAIGVGGKEIRSESALEHVWGYGVGFDMNC